MILSMMMTRLLPHVVVLHNAVDVLKWWPILSFLSHRWRGPKKMMNRYHGLRVSP